MRWGRRGGGLRGGEEVGRGEERRWVEGRRGGRLMGGEGRVGEERRRAEGRRGGG